jgi:pyrroloquinoline quinone (PQQ) biosynthesis protein C
MGLTARRRNQALPGEAFLDELEEVRSEFLQGKPFRDRKRGATKDELAAAKRRKHLGGDGNHRFEGERYLNCPEKPVRRTQLRKLIDEGGQDAVGGPMPSHPRLDIWNSIEMGLTEEEVLELSKRDPSAESLIVSGWWFGLQRDSHWAVAIGSSLVGEGEKRLSGAAERYLALIEEKKKEYAAMGVDVQRAIQLDLEHAPTGVDAEHAEFGANVVRQYVDSAELQQEMERAFILTLQGRGSRSF